MCAIDIRHHRHPLSAVELWSPVVRRRMRAMSSPGLLSPGVELESEGAGGRAQGDRADAAGLRCVLAMMRICRPWNWKSVLVLSQY